ncbi:MFS transporter [soil metagenome]
MPIKNKRALFAGIFGNALEWYDFTAYAFFAPIIATLFFPAKDPFTSLLMTFGVFALGFLVRPFGGVLFGYIGDHFGRKKALILSLIVVSCSTLLLGLLPSYASWGWWAPLLLTLLRVAQGVAVSGEVTSAASFLVEHAQPNRRGLAGSLVMCSALIGIVLSSATTTFITVASTQAQLLSFGWRLPFIFGALAGFIGLFLRLRMQETQHYQESMSERTTKTTPSVLKHLIDLDYKRITLSIFVTCIMAVGNWFVIAYFNTFLIKTEGLPNKEVMTINFICLVFWCLLLPIMGWLSDKLGRKPLLGFGMIGFLLFTHPIFWLLSQHNITYALIGELLFVLILAPVTALIPTTLAELFHVRIRNSGVSIGYNISLALFGGTAPLIAIALVAETHNAYAPAWYLIGCACISLLALLFIEESHKKPLL